MTNKQHPQPAQGLAGPGVDSEDASTRALSDGSLSTEDLDVERAELDRAWAEFSGVRASVGEVMSDDELRDFGINVEALDERP